MDFEPKSLLRYSRKLLKYLDDSGKVLSAKAVRKIVDGDIEATAGRLYSILQDFQSGRLDEAQFRADFKKSVSNLHLAHVAAAQGGFRNMNQAAWGFAGQRIRQQYTYVDGLVSDIQQGLLSGPKGLLRMKLWASSAMDSYEAMLAKVHNSVHFPFAENLLNQQNISEKNCPICTGLTALGITDRDDIPLPEDRHFSCNCGIAYHRTLDGD